MATAYRIRRKRDGAWLGNGPWHTAHGRIYTTNPDGACVFDPGLVRNEPPRFPPVPPVEGEEVVGAEG